MSKAEDLDKVRYAQVPANPGFFKCQRPECKDARGVRSGEVYSHAWEKHHTNHVTIEAQAKQKNQEQQ